MKTMNYWEPYKAFILKNLLLEAKSKEEPRPYNLTRFCCRDFSGLKQVAFLIDLSANRRLFSFDDVKLNEEVATFLEENSGWVISEVKQDFVNKMIPILKKEAKISTEEDLGRKVGGIVRRVFDKKTGLEKKRETYSAEKFEKWLIANKKEIFRAELILLTIISCKLRFGRTNIKKLEGMLKKYITNFINDNLTPKSPQRTPPGYLYKFQKENFLNYAKKELTKCVPREMNICDREIWPDLKERQRIKFWETLLALEQENFICIREAVDCSEAVIDLKPGIVEGRLLRDATNIYGHKKTKPIFNLKSSEIVWEDKKCPIPPGTIEFYMCKLLFDKPFGEKVTEGEIMTLVDHEKCKVEHMRTIYDAHRRINKRVKESLGIPNLLEYGAAKVWIRGEIFK